MIIISKPIYIAFKAKSYSHSGDDYRDDTALLTLPAGATEICTNFVIINDLAEEGNETFSVTLEALYKISVDISTAVVTIIDDES